MRNFARFENNKVVEVFDLDAHHPELPGIEGLFHADLDWVACAPDTQIGDVMLDGQVVAHTNYKALRAETPAYQNHGEQLGALVKAVQALGANVAQLQFALLSNGIMAASAGTPIPPDAVAVLDSIEAVKAKYPKK